MDLTNLFLSGADYNTLAEAVGIVKRNSRGNIWLVGGYVYRTIASQMYGHPKPDVDLDFVVEAPCSEFSLPSGWRIDVNKYGNPKLVNGSRKIDYNPLGNIHSILQRQIEPTIWNYLTGVPLTIQSIAFDVDATLIIGDIGIDALKRKVVEVNDFAFAVYAADKKQITLREMIQQKADSLGFTPVFPETQF